MTDLKDDNRAALLAIGRAVKGRWYDFQEADAQESADKADVQTALRFLERLNGYGYAVVKVVEF